MTSLLPPRPGFDPRAAARAVRSASEVAADLRHRRPLAVVGVLGGIAAAGGLLVVCLALGVVGWFLSDAGAHGAPSGGLRAGAVGWLLGHGSGLTVEGAGITAMPLGVTLVAAWSAWRFGLRVGDAVSGHGPDAERLADGERDWTVGSATLSFVIGYLLVGVIALHAAGHGLQLSLTGLITWTVLLAGGVGGVAIAVGSGRAATWASLVPPSVRAGLDAVRLLLLTWLGVATAVLLLGLIVHFPTAVNVMSQLHANAGAAVLYTLLTLLTLPNASLFSGAYLLGPGFAVGVGTVVAPGHVSVGALPMFPLFAALPHSAPAWAHLALVTGPVVAAYAVARTQHRRPTLRWETALLRGVGAAVVAGIVLGILSGMSGGAIGPGRMSHLGPSVWGVLSHAVMWFGLGGLVASAGMTWWQRRTMLPPAGAAADAVATDKP